MLWRDSFELKIDATNCISLVQGLARFDDGSYDLWRYRNQTFQSGKIYGLVGEFHQGCMYLSYLLGGKVDFENLKIYYNGIEVSREDLFRNSWNLEPSKEKYRKAVVKKSIEKALKGSDIEEDFSSVARRFMLTEPRYDRKLFQLSGERWRASAALGYASGKRIFYAPYESSEYYYNMCQSGLWNVFKELADSGAIVLLPVGSDVIMKHIADECIYVGSDFDVDALQDRYAELENWKGM